MVQAGVDGMHFTVDSAPNLCELRPNLEPFRRDHRGRGERPAVLGRQRHYLADICDAARLGARSSVHVAMTSCGCSRSISFAVPKAEVAVAVDRLHREFLPADPEVFAATPESARCVPVIHRATPKSRPGGAASHGFSKEFVIDFELTGRIRSLVRWAGLL